MTVHVSGKIVEDQLLLLPFKLNFSRMRININLRGYIKGFSNKIHFYFSCVEGSLFYSLTVLIMVSCVNLHYVFITSNTSNKIVFDLTQDTLHHMCLT